MSNEHKIKRADGRPGAYVFTCTCGWKSQTHATQRDAMREWETHANASDYDTSDNRDTLRVCIEAGDDVDFGTSGVTLWRVNHGDGFDPVEITERFRIDLQGTAEADAARQAEIEAIIAEINSGSGEWS